MKKFKSSESSGYEQISPTAWTVAYKRALADIPYAREIFEELLPSIDAADQKDREYFESAKDSNNTPQLEARYKLIDRILGEQKPSRILEIASGLTPRGLAMAQADSSIQYVEVDLPNVASDKQRILDELASKGITIPTNLSIVSGDALDFDSLRTAAGQFDEGEITVINEGLMRYLTFDQKAKYADNVHRLLQERGGVWITPDVTLRKVIMSESQGAEYDRISKVSGIDINANSFRDVAHAKEFMESHRFIVEIRSFAEIEDGLVTPEKIGMSRNQAHDTLKDAVVLTMRTNRS